ncbi:MAG: hypothetical protein QM820_56100 [Minicystis sp.]
MKKAASLVSTLLLAATFGLPAASHPAAAEARCHKVHAHITDTVTTEGCDSPVGLCTSGVVTGDGLLHGTIDVTVLGFAPGATPDTLSVDAIDTFHTAHGDVTFHVSGHWDPVTGVFTFVDQQPAGTGRFEGATGRLYDNGAVIAEGTFDSDVSGEICLAR